MAPDSVTFTTESYFCPVIQRVLPPFASKVISCVEPFGAGWQAPVCTDG